MNKTIEECPICLENVDGSNNYVATINECMHSFCDICLLKHLKHHSLCPMCRSECKSYVVYMKNEQIEYDLFFYKIESIESIEYETNDYETIETMNERQSFTQVETQDTFVRSFYLTVASGIVVISFLVETFLLVYILINVMKFVVFVVSDYN